jgi:hypothetical protein
MDLCAFLKLTMSLEQAKVTLGFPPDASPSPVEINKAWRAKAFAAHPDRGGDNDQMVAINVAKDVLEGKQRPTYDRSSPTYNRAPDPAPAPAPAPKTDYSQRLDYTFVDAFKRAKLPSEAYWMWVSTGTSINASLDGYTGKAEGWVLYGRTSKTHVFVGVQFVFFQGDYDPNESSEPMTEGVFFSDPVLYPLTKPFKSIQRKGFSEAIKKLRYNDLRSIPFDPKMHVVSTQGVRYVHDNWFLSPSGAAVTADVWLAEIGEIDQQKPLKIVLSVNYPEITLTIDGVSKTATVDTSFYSLDSDVEKILAKFFGLRELNRGDTAKKVVDARFKQIYAFTRIYKRFFKSQFSSEVDYRLETFLSKITGDGF